MKKIILLVLIVFSIQISYSEPKWTPIWKDLNVNSSESSVAGMQALDSLDFIIWVWHQGFCKLASSKDGAKTWEIIYDETWNEDIPGSIFPDPQYANSMAYPYKDHIYLAFEKGQLRHSRNRGMTFDTVFNFSRGPMSNLVMADTSLGIVCHTFNTKVDPDYYQRKLYITTDGWNTHSTVNIDTINGNPLNVCGIYLKSADRFSFISPRSDIGAFYYSTTNGGNSWDEFNLSNLINGVKNCHLSSLYFLNDSLGWISGMEPNNVGDQKIDVIFKTTNGGKAWEVNYRKENESIFGLQNIVFYDANNGIAVGAWGKILRTTDGGVTWIQEYLKDKNTIIKPTSMNVCYMGSKPILGVGGGVNILWRLDGFTSAEDNSEVNSLCLFPNPINKNQKFNIDYNTIEIKQDITVKILDITGKELENYELAQNSNSVHLECQLPNYFTSGTYLVYIESEGEILAKEKLIIE